MRSKLYAGNVRHRRFPPRDYQFTYGVYYFDLDLDEIDEVARRIKLFSHNRRNMLSFYDRDHMAAPGRSLRDSMRAHLAAMGMDFGECTVSLLTTARVLNYVFNPVSFYFVRSRGGGLRHVIAEVHNTHGERHSYDLTREESGACAGTRLVTEGGRAASIYASSAQKQFYVSPFIDMDARYAFRLSEQGGRVLIGIDEYRDGEVFFQAELDLAARPLTNANVARMLLRYPLVTFKTIALIHWHGLKLWLRGERYRKHISQEARR